MSAKKWLFLMVTAVMALFASSAMAATSVSWLSPANGSSYLAGTDVDLAGNANASGISGGTGLDLMLVIDISGSMGTYYSGKTRLDWVQEAAVSLINSLPDNTTQVGIIAYDHTVNTVKYLQDLTSNKASLVTAVNALNYYGNTYTGEAINAATTELTSVRAIAGHSKMMVVMSDGAWNGYVNPVTAATAAYGQNIIVHTVGVQLSGSAYTSMQNTANAGHGIFTNVSDLSQLESLFDGTGGNLVGLNHVDLLAADGTWYYNVAIDGLGNFILPDQAIQLGANTFTAYAYGSDNTSATAQITLYGTAVPEPTTMLLFGVGLAGLTGLGRMRKA